jgi:hypothetical protein
VIPEASFFFSVAAISVTLAGFSGLVAAFRRGDQLRTVEVFHLRGIAETGLANALIALMTIPVATIAGDLRKATPVRPRLAGHGRVQDAARQAWLIH